MSLKDGLVSYYKMDTNGSFPDVHGTNDGTINGATYTASGKINGGYSFDGVNDYVVVNQTNTTNISVNFWLKGTNAASSGSYSKAFSYGYNGATGPSMDFSYDHEDGSFRQSFSIFNGTSYFAAGLNSTLVGGEWNMLTCTFDGTTLKSYLNGVFQNQVTHTGTIQSRTLLNIGRWFGGSQYINGDMDEYGQWNEALTQEEITELYNSGAGLSYDSFDPPAGFSNIKLGTNTINKIYLGANEIKKAYLGANLIYDKTATPNGLLNNLVSYYPFDGNVEDVHGTNNGTSYGTSDVVGKIDRGRGFDGNNDYISGVASPIDVSGNFSISLWIKYNEISPNKVITIVRGNSSGAGLIGKTAFTNAPGFSVYNGAWNDLAQTTTVAGTWYNQVLVREGTSVKLYVNGVLDKSITVTGTITNGTDQNVIGKYYSDYFDGTFDEYGIWNKALTQTEITTLYNSGAGLSYDSFTT